MVMYPYPANMYRHQQGVHNNAWYPSGYHQSAQMTPGATYCMQEEQQMWHPHHSHPVFHNVNDFANGEFVSAIPHGHQIDPAINQLPSPTVSGSEMSSPGTSGSAGNISPANTNTSHRPPPARSPYEWIKKTSYQSQPNPGKTRTKDKYRVVYTDHQRVELEKEFYYSRYITIRRKSELANSLGLSERQVKIWFQNRRAKERKQVKKREEFTIKDNGLNNGINISPQEQQQMLHGQTQLNQGIMQPGPLI